MGRMRDVSGVAKWCLGTPTQAGVGRHQLSVFRRFRGRLSYRREDEWSDGVRSQRRAESPLHLVARCRGRMPMGRLVGVGGGGRMIQAMGRRRHCGRRYRPAGE